MTNKIIIFLIFIPMTFGFRTYFSENMWKGLTNDTAASRKLFVKYTNGTTAVSNDLKSGDVLAGSGDTLTVDQMMQSIFDDFNAVSGAWVELVPITDSDYAELKTIDISFGGASGGNTGEAELNWSGDDVSGCTIAADDSLLDSAKDFIGTMTHELGHCLQLDHPQETTHSIMSYFADFDIPRIKMDDKMGLIFLYPINAGAAEEDSTFGLSCSRRNN